MIVELTNKKSMDVAIPNMYRHKIFVYEKKDLPLLSQKVRLFEQSLGLLENLKRDVKVKARLEKLLRIGTNLMNLETKESNKRTKLIHKKKDEPSIIFKKLKPDDCLDVLEEITVSELNVDELLDYLAGVEPKNVSIAERSFKEPTITLFFPKDFLVEHKNHELMFVENITGDFYYDAILGLFEEMKSLDVYKGLESAMVEFFNREAFNFNRILVKGIEQFLKSFSMGTNNLTEYDDNLVNNTILLLMLSMENST